jgi:hypothetical protein
MGEESSYRRKVKRLDETINRIKALKNQDLKFDKNADLDFIMHGVCETSSIYEVVSNQTKPKIETYEKEISYVNEITKTSEEEIIVAEEKIKTSEEKVFVVDEKSKGIDFTFETPFTCSEILKNSFAKCQHPQCQSECKFKDLIHELQSYKHDLSICFSRNSVLPGLKDKLYDLMNNGDYFHIKKFVIDPLICIYLEGSQIKTSTSISINNFFEIPKNLFDRMY